MKTRIEENTNLQNIYNIKTKHEFVKKEYGLTNLWVNADNEKAIHVYEKCGYKKVKPTMYLMERGKWMKLIIDISEKDYRRGTVMASAIRNGIPLPKGCGRLIDADRAVREENSKMTDFETTNTRDRSYCRYAMAILNDAPTIIEADKEEKQNEQTKMIKVPFMKVPLFYCS